MRDAAAEAWELAEHGLITEDDFRDFVFANPVRAKAEVNPGFLQRNCCGKKRGPRTDGNGSRSE